MTASIDWCETNYAWSPFVAEFWNTVSMTNMDASKTETIILRNNITLFTTTLEVGDFIFYKLFFVHTRFLSLPGGGNHPK